MTITLNKSITSELVCADTFGYTLHQSNLISAYVRPCYQECHIIQFGNVKYDVMLQNGVSFFHGSFGLPDYNVEVYSIEHNGERIHLDDIELSHPDLYEYMQGLCHDATNKLDTSRDDYEYLMVGHHEYNYGEEIRATYDEMCELNKRGYAIHECFPK